jgi:triosephosphate isomerase
MNAERTPLLAGNWKLNMHWQQCEEYAAALQELLPEYFTADASGAIAPAVELAICPAAPYITLVHRLLEDSAIFVGAQDVSRFDEGAFTGEVSAAMLSDTGCDYCIVGHSERRELRDETDADVAHKLTLLRAADVIPILCIGETLDVREAGRAVDHTLGQLNAIKESLAGFDVGGLVIAYEPVWAIGSGLSAEPKDALEMSARIRGWVNDHLGDEQAESTLVLYGGSVTPENIGSFLDCADIDGALVGGASLDPGKFAAMAKQALARI